MDDFMGFFIFLESSGVGFILRFGWFNLIFYCVFLDVGVKFVYVFNDVIKLIVGYVVLDFEDF